MTPTTALPDAPRRVTPDDSGSTFALRLGATTSFVLRDPAAPEPQAEGSSVLVIPTVNIQDSGVREWELRAVAPGTTTIRGAGAAYEITFVVR
jgi:predicted secreted protein